MYEWNWPIFILIDELWKTINLRNGSIPVREGSYIFDIPFFNDFAMYVQGIQQELPDDKKLTVFDVLAMCEVRDGAKQPTDKQIAHRLEKMGYLEKHGKTNAQYYILPHAYYELSGMLKTEGERGQMVYKIGDSYLENNAIMNKALKIGLKELINKGEILKGE